jgi:hypothetical protein
MDIAVVRAQERKLKILLLAINSTKEANAFKDFKGCTDTCNCRGCENPYGGNVHGEEKIATLRQVQEKGDHLEYLQNS